MRDFMKIIMDWYLGLGICSNKQTCILTVKFYVNIVFNWSVSVFPKALKKLDLGELLSSYVSASG